MKRFFALSVLLAAFCNPAFADGFGSGMIKKQDEKARRRWSLSDWLETKDRMRMMDLWLAMNSPSPFEFFVGGNFRMAVNPNTYGWSAYAGLYAAIFGLKFQYEQLGNARMYGTFHLRVFGLHDQATHLTAEFGIRNDDGLVPYRSLFPGVDLTLYFGKFFGIDGLYRHYFPSTPTAAGVSFSGDRLEGGAFIEVRMLRIYGKYFYEWQYFGSTAMPMQGIVAGGRFYL